MSLLPGVDCDLTNIEEVSQVFIDGAEAAGLRGLVNELRLVIGRAPDRGRLLGHALLCAHYFRAWQVLLATRQRVVRLLFSIRGDQVSENIEPKDFTKQSVTERFYTLIRNGQILILFLVLVVGAATSMSYYQSLQTEQERLYAKAKEFNYLQERIKSLQELNNKMEETVSTVNQLHARLSSRDDYVKSGMTILQYSIEEMRNRLKYLSQEIEQQNPYVKRSSGLSIITSAYADTSTETRTLSPVAKRWVLGLVLLSLATAFIVSIVAIFKTANPAVLQFAFDTVKSLLGFFIGVATTLMGTS